MSLPREPGLSLLAGVMRILCGDSERIRDVSGGCGEGAGSWAVLKRYLSLELDADEAGEALGLTGCGHDVNIVSRVKNKSAS